MEKKELEQALQDLCREHGRVMAMCEILARIVGNHEKRLNSAGLGKPWPQGDFLFGSEE
jgi:hypothetical protein